MGTLLHRAPQQRYSRTLWLLTKNTLISRSVMGTSQTTNPNLVRKGYIFFEHFSRVCGFIISRDTFQEVVRYRVVEMLQFFETRPPVSFFLARIILCTGQYTYGGVLASRHECRPISSNHGYPRNSGEISSRGRKAPRPFFLFSTYGENLKFRLSPQN